MLEGHVPPQRQKHSPSPAPWNPDWTPSFQPMRSAYLEANSVEPEYTNFGFTGRQTSAFIGTLDYILLSPEWKVDGAGSLPSLKELQQSGVQSYPSKQEPSDHLLIAADLHL